MNISDIKPEDIKELLKERLLIDSIVTMENSLITNTITIRLDGKLVETHQFSKRLTL
jgi:hypothetical protein